jgi:hypothetical protein
VSLTPPGRRREPGWAALSDAELLELRICDLGLRLETTPLAERVEELHAALERAGLRFRPPVWLSTAWFSPDGVPGLAMPFFLAHPRLAKLERAQMFFVEGGTRGGCMKLLRHEAGHALDTAYRLHRRRDWRLHFGPASVPYRRTYVPRPDSRYYVHNLDGYYAQSHPIEDFAETFAVWLGSRGRWRREYAGWRALRKLEYVDTLMRELRDQSPRVHSRERTEALHSVRMTLREYYRRRRTTWGEADLQVYDRDLARLFGSGGRGKRANVFLRERRASLRRQISRWTGQQPFVVDEVLGSMIRRCRALGLRLAHAERESAEGAAVLVTMHTLRIRRMRYREYVR